MPRLWSIVNWKKRPLHMHMLQNKFEDPSPQFLLIGWILNLGGHQWKLRESSRQDRETISTRGAALEWPFESRTKSNPRPIGPSPWTISRPKKPIGSHTWNRNCAHVNMHNSMGKSTHQNLFRFSYICLIYYFQKCKIVRVVVEV